MRRRPRSLSQGSATSNESSSDDQSISILSAFEHENNPSRPVRPSPLATSTLRGIPLDLLDRIRSFPVFASAPDSFLTAIGSRMRLQVFNRQETVLNEGDSAKAMYWLVKGAVVVCSRDRESVYAELMPGAFFGEIGCLMNVPRTATVFSKYKSLVVRLTKEDLEKELPNYPEVERSIREEAAERLAVLERKRSLMKKAQQPEVVISRIGKRQLDNEIVEPDEDSDVDMDGRSKRSKRHKSASPTFQDAILSSALGRGDISIRETLKQLPLFASLPDDVLHFIGLNAIPRSYEPFHHIIEQGSTGKEIFFIVAGEVEVFIENEEDASRQVKARLKAGQYFGEVATLSFAPRRTASVRSVSSVECLVISGQVIDEILKRCPPELRQRVEETARERLRQNRPPGPQRQNSIESGVGSLGISDKETEITLEQGGYSPEDKGRANRGFSSSPFRQQLTVPSPLSPDVFFNADKASKRSAHQKKSSHSSTPKFASPLAPPGSSPTGWNTPPPTPPPRSPLADLPMRPKLNRRVSEWVRGIFPRTVLINIFKHLPVQDLMVLRSVSSYWSKIISTDPDIFHELDLSPHSRELTDEALSTVVAPYAGNRPRRIDLSNCYHISDEGFSALINHCSANLEHLCMKSVWDVSPHSILEMTMKARELRSVDFSNCRKVSDNLLARIVGWVVRSTPPAHLLPPGAPPQPPAGTVIGCPNLRTLSLSYCKHVSDRFMAHLALHAHDRLENLDLTRCTTISDLGFRHWSERSFPRLTKLILADCTYLSDNAIVYLTRCARNLKVLDLSFCCALSDASVDALSSNLYQLESLNLAFCGSAVSDASMASIGGGLTKLRKVSVRGCVRVTGAGVESILEGCPKLQVFDVSQCRNLKPWAEDPHGWGAWRERIWKRRVALMVVAKDGMKDGTGGVKL